MHFFPSFKAMCSFAGVLLAVVVTASGCAPSGTPMGGTLLDGQTTQDMAAADSATDTATTDALSQDAAADTFGSDAAIPKDGDSSVDGLVAGNTLYQAAVACKLLGKYSVGPAYPLDASCTKWDVTSDDLVTVQQSTSGGLVLKFREVEFPIDNLKAPCQFSGTGCRDTPGSAGATKQQGGVVIGPMENGATSSDQWAVVMGLDTMEKGKMLACEGVNLLVKRQTSAPTKACPWVGTYKLDGPPVLVNDSCGKSWVGAGENLLEVSIDNFGLNLKLLSDNTTFTAPKPSGCSTSHVGELLYMLNGEGGIATLALNFTGETVAGKISLTMGDGKAPGCSGSWTLSGKLAATAAAGGPAAGALSPCPAAP